MCFLMCIRNRRSRILEMLLRLGIGLKLERLLVSRPDFLSKGVTRADFKDDRKHSNLVGQLCNKLGETTEQEPMSGVGMPLGMF